jgi:hypothetical protein
MENLASNYWSFISRAVTIRRERTAVYRGTATLYRGTYRDILQNMYLWRKQQNNKFYKLY